MIEIGKYQELEVNREVDFGVYLGKLGEAEEVLLPKRYVTDEIVSGSRLTVFVYRDSEGRPVATTEIPYATVGEFAFLHVRDVNDAGAFLDWGLTAKDLLVPYSEQRSRMRVGGVYLVYIYLDSTTGRIVATSKTDKYLGNVYPDFKPGRAVTALVTEQTEIGYKVIVNNLHRGIIYLNEIFKPIELRSTITAYVKRVRDDGKIDLTLSDRADRRTAELSSRILDYLDTSDALPLHDKMPPELIEELFQSSKKDFKKAVGHLYKEHKIEMDDQRRIKKL